MALAACLCLAACGDAGPPRAGQRAFAPDTDGARLHWSTQAGAVEPIPVVSTPRVNVSRPRRTPPGPGEGGLTGSGRCGGDLPPCHVLACESGGSLTAHNPSGADGKWQFTSWGNYGGYPSASSAPEEVQDAKAREMYRARGTQPWSQCA